jgi:hypothetical protein
VIVVNHDIMPDGSVVTTRFAPTMPPRKGELVTCEAGHIICEVMEDIALGQLNWHEHLGAWRLEHPPALGSQMICPCGERWGSEDSLHIKDRGWV